MPFLLPGERLLTEGQLIADCRHASRHVLLALAELLCSVQSCCLYLMLSMCSSVGIDCCAPCHANAVQLTVILGHCLLWQSAHCEPPAGLATLHMGMSASAHAW